MTHHSVTTLVMQFQLPSYMQTHNDTQYTTISIMEAVHYGNMGKKYERRNEGKNTKFKYCFTENN